MKVLAIDDEEIALEGLVEAIREAEASAEIHSFQKTEEALEFYRTTPCEVAHLVDRSGAYCSNAEIMAALWEDEKKTSYLGNLKKDLLDTLREKRCQDIVETGWGRLRIDTEKVDCDYYKWCKGELAGINSYRGEYMTQYSWAEFTNAGLAGK